MKNLEVTKMTNRQKIESFLKQIETQLSLHIEGVDIGDGYFIFEFGEDTVCHFKIKEIPGFLFGIWVENNLNPDIFCNVKSNDELIFFTQYERDLNKFKPSASGFVAGSRRTVWEEQPNGEELVRKEEWELYLISDILTFMKKHPIKAYYYSWMEVPYIWDEQPNDFKILKYYIHSWLYHWRTEWKRKIQLKKQIKNSIKFAKHNKSYYCNIRDFGSDWSPRIHIEFRQKPDIDENSKQFIKDDAALEKFENKWCTKISIDYMQHPDKRKDKKYKRLFKHHLQKFDDETLLYHNYDEDTLI